MTYNNKLEGKLSELERELRVAELNGWEFDAANLREEIEELEIEIDREFNMAYEE